MTTLRQAAATARRLPEVVEGDRDGSLTWSVHGRTFAWERAFSKADIRRYGDVPAPDGVILAVRVGDLAEKEAVLAAGAVGVFTIPHFDGFAAVLVQLRAASLTTVRDVLVDGWLALAPPQLADQHASRLLRRRARRRW